MTKPDKVEIDCKAGDEGEPGLDQEMALENLRHLIAQRDLTIQRRDRLIKELEASLRESEHRHGRDLTKLSKWADRVVTDFRRGLEPNRGGLGGWLSLKSSGAKSKGVRRLAALIESRPQPANAVRPATAVDSIVDSFAQSFRE